MSRHLRHYKTNVPCVNSLPSCPKAKHHFLRLLRPLVVGLGIISGTGIFLPEAGAQQSSTSAQDRQATESATKQTQELLRNQQQREKSLTTPEAKNADKQVKELMGSDSQALYELAADILPSIINESNGDPIKIQASMDQLMKNPESFSSKLTPSQLARLKELAKKVEDRKPSGTSPR